MARRAVITGAGVLSPLGHDLAAFRAGLAASTPGVRRLQSYDPAGLPCPLFAELAPAFDAKKFIPAANKDGRKSLSKMAKTVQMGLCASQLCMDDAGLKKGDVSPFRFGIEFGCVMVATEIADLARAAQKSVEGDTVNLEKWGRDGQPEIIPIWLLKFMPNMPACHTSIFFDAQGPNNTVTVEDAAGLLALGEAYRLLVRDSADFFLVGACESKMNPVSFARHNTFTTYSKRHDTPGSAVRPFDKTRDGTAFGEAATTLGLEELDCAKARNAKIYAELIGFAAGFDRKLTGKVLATVIRNALKEAGIQPGDVDHVNAHAAGYDYDAFEARAIAEVFGDKTPVIALKGQIGHSGAASGLTEMLATLLALQTGERFGTLNYSEPDPACPINVQRAGSHAVTKPYALKDQLHRSRPVCRGGPQEVGRLMGRRVVITGFGRDHPAGEQRGGDVRQCRCRQERRGHDPQLRRPHIPHHVRRGSEGLRPRQVDSRKRNDSPRAASTPASPWPRPSKRSNTPTCPAGGDRTRLGVYMGSGEGSEDFRALIVGAARAADENGLKVDTGKFAGVMFSFLDGARERELEMHTPAGHIAEEFDLCGPNYACLTACAASAQALGEAAAIIRHGDAEVMLSGGSHSMIHPLGMTGFNRLTALSTFNECPQKASRPFDLTRTGFVLGEGAGMLVLEELEHAKARKANIYAELTGYGTTGDAHAMTDPHPDGVGAIQAMKMALSEAGLNADDIGYINAHGTSTRANDSSETNAIKGALGHHAYKTPVSSSKSMLGHLIAAGGAVELIISILAMRNGVLPPTINYETPDPACDLDYVPNAAREKKGVRHVLSNSFGFGGQNITLIASRIYALSPLGERGGGRVSDWKVSQQSPPHPNPLPQGEREQDKNADVDVDRSGLYLRPAAHASDGHLRVLPLLHLAVPQHHRPHLRREAAVHHPSRHADRGGRVHGHPRRERPENSRHLHPPLCRRAQGRDPLRPRVRLRPLGEPHLLRRTPESWVRRLHLRAPQSGRK